MYIVHFQKPGEADAVLNNNVRRAFNFFMRRPQADQPPSEGFATPTDGKKSAFPLVRMLQAYDPANDHREKFLSDDEFEFVVHTFERTGFTGGINWYRNLTRDWERSEDLPSRIDGIPCLMITAEKDAVLPPSGAAHMPQFISDLETVMVKGSGHFTQQEKPEEVNKIIIDWLKRRF